MTEPADKSIEVAPARPVPGRRSTVPVSVVFALITAILVAVPLAVVAIVNIDANRDNTFALLNQRAILLTDALETGIRRHLDDAASAVDFFAGEYAAGAIDLGDREATQSVLRGMSAALGQVEALLVYHGDRQIAGVFRTREGEYGDLPAEDEQSADVRRELAASRARAGPAWGSLVYRDGRVYANYGAPLIRDGVRDGLLVAAVSITTVSEIVTDISDKYDTIAFILDDGERVVAHPNLISGHPELGESTPTISLTRIGDPIVAAFPERKSFDTFATAGAEGVEVSNIQIGERDYVVINRAVAGFGPRPWIIGAHFTAADAGSEVERLARVALVSLAALVISVVVAFLISRLMSRPISRFTRQTALITDLALDEVSHLPRSRIRELDHGATAFNAMLDGLKAFAAYVPRTLVTRLVLSGVKATTQSSERRMTVMFTDIVGFTSLGERKTAAEVAHLLNHHFRILTLIVESHGGTVDKFIGDAMMAFWGAPEPMEDHAAAACRAALEIAEAMHADNARRTAEGGVEVRMRIGIHTGEVIVGNIGGGGRINYTVIGDAVNVAQRLEDLGREVAPDSEVTILVSADTAREAGTSFTTKKAGAPVLRGRRSQTEALLLTGGDESGAGRS